MPEIIFDGWALARAPGSPAARHLESLLAVLPPEIPVQVARPGPDILATALGQLRWDQWKLPHLAVHSHAKSLQLFDVSVPLLNSTPVYIFPSVPWHERQAARDGWAGRLQAALKQGGRSRPAQVFWPSDFPLPDIPPAWKVFHLPPLIHPAFLERNRALPPELEQELPTDYILCPGPLELESLQLLLSAWIWAAGSIGGSQPLLLQGIDEQAAKALVAEYTLDDTVFFCQALPTADLASLYHHCAALVYPGRLAPWGDALRPALACGKPVVSVEYEETAACVGPAAYLAPRGDARALGAALITVVGEEDVANQLSQAGLDRSIQWSEEDFVTALLKSYSL